MNALQRSLRDGQQSTIVAKKIYFVIMYTLMHKCKKNTFFSSCSRLIVAFACITKQCLHILLTPIRPPQSNLIHSCTYRHIEKKKKKKPTQSPTHRISDKRAPSTSPIQPSYWMFGFQYNTSVCVCRFAVCYLFLFLMLFGCAAGERN